MNFRPILLLLALWALCSLPSCHKCELIEQVVTPPPASRCEGTFYINKAEPGVDLRFSLHEFGKPVSEAFASVSKAGPFGVPTPSFFDIRSNFSAYDSIGRRYVYQHYYGAPPATRFFSHLMTNGISTHTALFGDWVCPVFHKGRLYGIFTELVSGDEWIYNLTENDPVSGEVLFAIFGGNPTTNSPLSAGAMSSVSTGGDLIYFLSGTNLIEMNLQNNTTRHIDIDPSFHPVNNFVTYFGLEYKRDEGILLAMKNAPDTTGSLKTSLVSIKVTTGAPVITTLFDISAAMPAGTDGYVNNEYYSSAFDPCDNTYYITCMESNMGLSNSNFIEINLPENEMKTLRLDGYWYGLEFAGR